MLLFSSLTVFLNVGSEKAIVVSVDIRLSRNRLTSSHICIRISSTYHYRNHIVIAPGMTVEVRLCELTSSDKQLESFSKSIHRQPLER